MSNDEIIMKNYEQVRISSSLIKLFNVKRWDNKEKLQRNSFTINELTKIKLWHFTRVRWSIFK